MIEKQGGEIVGTLESWLCRLMRKVIREEMAVKSEPPTSIGEQVFASVQQAAKLAGVRASTLRTWIAKGVDPTLPRRAIYTDPDSRPHGVHGSAADGQPKDHAGCDPYHPSGVASGGGFRASR